MQLQTWIYDQKSENNLNKGHVVYKQTLNHVTEITVFNIMSKQGNHVFSNKVRRFSGWFKIL